ncbi:MAG: sugar phosphate isomerase/epimerase [Planctomycetes bacterium]|nr:sugar phosphate isomerase/epimerase [Planctomycetota bacterium]
MFTLSAFADEIDPDPHKQIDVLKACGVRHIEFRSILGTNVLALSDLQIREFQSLLAKHGFWLSAIGSPIGKIKIDDPFEPHLEKFKRAIYLCGVFGVKNIRIFSYYPPDNFDWNVAVSLRETMPHAEREVYDKWRSEVMSRMTQKCELAAKAGVRLVHENEHRIFGDSPERVTDLMTTLRAKFNASVIGAVHDPANFVFCGYDPWQGWLASKPFLVHFHIKDWIAKAEHGSLAGEGQGRIPEVIADAVKMGYDGFATLEPHLLGGGPTGGVTGPELFPKAVAAFKKILDDAGATYR